MSSILMLYVQAATSGTIDISGSLSSDTYAKIVYLTVSDAGWTVSSDDSDASEGTVSLDGMTITAEATDGKTTTSSGCSDTTTYYQTTVSFTLTNTYSTKMTLSYSASTSYSGNSSGSLAVDGTAVSGSGTLELESGETATVTLTSQGSSSNTSKSTTTTGEITFTAVEVEVAQITTTFSAGENGTYTIERSDGTVLSIGESDTVSSEDGYTYTLTATADDGYELAYWLNTDTGNPLSADNPCVTAGGCTIQPVFKLEGIAMYYIKGLADVTYEFLDEAIDAAGSSGTIVLGSSGTVYGSGGETEFTIPSGVTFLMPYSQDDLGTGNNFSYDNSELTQTTSNGKLDPYTCESIYLNILSGYTITVNGKFIIGGTLYSNAGNAMATDGDHANLYLEGDLVMNSGSVLSVCGYILGDGNIAVSTGTAVYQPLVVMDYRGGGYVVGASGESSVSYGITASSYTNTEESYIMPFIRYTVENIQADMDFYSGAYMYVYCDLYANSQENITTGVMVGNSSKAGLITLSSGAVMHTSYDADDYVSPYTYVGKTTITIEGGASFGSLELEIIYKRYGITVADVTIDTSDFLFTIPYNYEINLNTDDSGSGTYTISNPMVIMPGAVIRVGSGASLTVNSKFIVYDGVDDYTLSGTSSSTSISATYSASRSASTVSSSYDYPTSALLQAAGYSSCGNFIVNGTVALGSSSTFAGIIQTEDTYDEDSGSGPVVSVNSSADLDYTCQIGQVGEYTFFSNTYYFAGATTYSLTGRIFDVTTGEITEMQTGATYYGTSGSYTMDSYDYRLYYSYSSSGGTSYSDYTMESMQTVSGAWWNIKGTLNIVAADGSGTVYGSNTMYLAIGTEFTEDMGYYSDAALSTLYTGTVSSSDNGTLVLYAPAAARVLPSGGDNPGDSEYYQSLQAALNGVSADDTVYVMMNTLSLDSAIAFAQSFHITLCFYDDYYNYTCSSITLSADMIKNSGDTTVNFAEGTTVTAETAVTLATNYEDGTLELNLNGAEITITDSSSTDGTAAIDNYGTMTLDMGGGSITLDTGTLGSSTTIGAAVYNHEGGTLTLTGGDSSSETGSITYTAAGYSGTITLGTSTRYMYFASVIRNEGDMPSIENVSLTGSGSAYTVGITNFDGGYICEINDTDITMSGTSSTYALYNLGGTIDTISGGEWSSTGYYGIMNRNIRTGTQNATSTTTNRYTVADEDIGTIGTIKDVTVEAKQYALYNGGVITTIGGSASFTASTYAVKNTNSWYYDTACYKYISSGTLERTYYYSKGMGDGIVPVIGEITDDVTITSTTSGGSNSYALSNDGIINTISGDVTISAAGIYGLAVTGGGYLGEITGNVSISAYQRAIQVSGGDTTVEVRTYTTSSYSYVSHYDYTYANSVIGSITGDSDGDGITITAENNYGILIYSTLGDISGKVTISAYQYGISVQGDSSSSACDYTTVYGTDDGSRYYVYTRVGASCGVIGGNEGDEITITASYRYAVNCNGTVEGIGLKTESGGSMDSPTVTLSAQQYGILVDNGNQAVLCQTVSSDTDEYDSSYYLTIYEYEYTYNKSTVNYIANCSITCTSSTWGICNRGYIGSIEDCTVSATSYIIGIDGGSNTSLSQVRYYRDTSAFGTTTSQFSATTIAYTREAAEIGSITGCTITGTGSYGISNSGKIGEISGNTITMSSERAISNNNRYQSEVEYGNLEITYDEDDSTPWTITQGSATVSEYGGTEITLIGWGNTISATKNTIINYGTITTIGGEDPGDGSEVTTVKATSGPGIYNIDGYDSDSVNSGTDDYVSAYIGSITNVETRGTSYGIQNGSGSSTYYPVIGEIGDGVVALSTSGSYGVYNNNSSYGEISLISGGDYYSTKGTRAYAVYLPDNQTYPDGYTLSAVTRSVTLSDGTSYDCYFVTKNAVTISFDASDGDGTMEDFEIDLSDTTSTQSLTANSFTYTTGSGYSLSFLGWTFTEDGSTADLEDQAGYTSTNWITQLKSLTGDSTIGAGSAYTIYAIWEEGYTLTFSPGQGTGDSVTVFISITDNDTYTITETGYTAADTAGDTTASGSFSFTAPEGLEDFDGWSASNPADGSFTYLYEGDTWSVTASDLLTALNGESGGEYTIYAVYIAADTVEYTITWGSLTYSYDAPVYSWSGDSLKYYVTDEGDGWENTEGENAGYVAVSNTGTAELEATVTFTPVSTLGWTPELTLTWGTATGQDTITVDSIAADSTETVYMTVSEDCVPEGDGSEGVTLGTVTITVSSS